MILPVVPYRFLRAKALGQIGGWLCGGVMLSWVASQSGPHAGTAVVHVTEPHVVVSVDALSFHVGEEIHEPLVCDLSAGEHRLTMTRDETVLYTETFSIAGGEELVLTTWKPPEGTCPTAEEFGIEDR